MPEAFVGVYWTLPVPWAGFRDLPAHVGDAARASRTIRYQQARARAYVQAEGGTMVGEIAMIDGRPDRATDLARDELRRRAAPYVGQTVTLLAVQFDEVQRWRRNPFLPEAARDLGLTLVGLQPDPMTIDGQVFDPARHFAAWRHADASAMAGLRLGAHTGLRAAMAAVPGGGGRWQAVADVLNGRGVRSIRGNTWTAENVRKLAGRLGLSLP